MRKQIKILDLFAGTQSVRKALEKDYDVDYIGIDIYSPEAENKILDMTSDDIVNKLITILPDNWKPDFIWASPICNKFSMCNVGSGGNFYFEKFFENDGSISIRERESWNFNCLPHMTKYKGTEKAYKDANQALKMYSNTKQVLDYFKNVPFAVENPSTALSKYILGKWGYTTKTNYCEYGFDYKKPTAIYSSHELNLKTCTHKKHSIRIEDHVGAYKDRSRVPEELIQSILEQIMKG